MAVWGIWILGCCSKGAGHKSLCSPHVPQIGETHFPIHQRSIGNPVRGDRNSILNLVLKLNHLFKFFEALNLVFACIHNEKDIKVMKFWNIFMTTLFYIQVKW